MDNKRVLSGMRPTGKLHLGHLIGVLSNWSALQEDYDCIFSVADWHALTTKYNQTEKIQEYTREMVIDWLSAGIDPEKSIIHIQSDVAEIAELQLLFSMITSVSRLERNPTYKEQIEELGMKDSVPLGLLAYPVLQAADILIYKAGVVPVGKDQLPHVEITRDIARRFNHVYDTEVFPIPEPKLGEVPKLLGIDGRKMSKSYGNAIYLSDGKDQIAEKINEMVTDPKRIRLDDPGHPEVCSVFDYYQIFAKKEADEVATQCRQAELGCRDCKARMTDVVVDYMSEFHQRRAKFEQNPEIVDQILAKGAKKAREIANETLTEVRQIMNLEN